MRRGSEGGEPEGEGRDSDILSHRCPPVKSNSLEQFRPYEGACAARVALAQRDSKRSGGEGAAAVLLALEPRASTMSHLPVDAVHPAAPCEPAVACVVASEPAAAAPQMENPLSLALEPAHDRCAPERSDGAAVCLRPGSLAA